MIRVFWRTTETGQEEMVTNQTLWMPCYERMAINVMNHVFGDSTPIVCIMCMRAVFLIAEIKRRF